MRRTPIYEEHRRLGAKLVDFAGWDMPIQYTGVVDEYHAVRAAGGLFDVSHMGRLRVAGRSALAFLQRVTTNDVSKLGVLESHYSMICNPAGGIKDDIFVYRVKPDEYLVCVNASNREKILSWLQAQGKEDLELVDRSVDLAQLALQGAAARPVLEELGITGLEGVRPRQCMEGKLLGTPTLITRTGYTGEPGYELYLPADSAATVWKALLQHGRAAGLKPAGLGARDLLRLEMAYLLYGNDITEETTPLEAGAEWAVGFHKESFIGKETLGRQKERGVARRLVAFELLEKAVPRHGFPIRASDEAGGKAIGEVTSGNLSPLLQKGIGLGYVPPAHASSGARLSVDIRGKLVPAVVVKPPFYKRAPR